MSSNILVEDDTVGRLRFLGTASGIPTKKRFSQTLIVESSHSSECIILDPSDGASGLLMKHDIDHNQVKAMFVTHMHGDHFLGIFHLVKSMQILARKKRLEVYVPLEGLSITRALLDAMYLDDRILRFPIEIKPIVEESTESTWTSEPFPFYHSSEYQVWAYNNRHLLRQKEQVDPMIFAHTFESYCFVLEVDAVRIGYSGNVAKPQELIPLVTHSDIIVTEVAHTDLEGLFSVLSLAGDKPVILTHYHPKFDSADSLFRHLAAKHGISNLVLVEDGDTYTFGSVKTCGNKSRGGCKKL